MKGVEFKLDETQTFLDVVISSAQVSGKLNANTLSKVFKSSPYGEFDLSEDNILVAYNNFTKAAKEESGEIVQVTIAEKKDAKVKFRIEDNDMVASLSITSAYGGHSLLALNVDQLIAMWAD